ncbi:MAG: GNAT family N-acetyltransferase [Erysipelotrichaceae bacterium]
MNEYVNLTFDNINEIDLCCAIGGKKHQSGVDHKKLWIKNKLNDGYVFRKLNVRGKTFIEYEPVESAWVPIIGHNYNYIYCLWVSGSFKGQGIGKELIEYAINDSLNKGKSGICTLVAKKKTPFVGDKKFFEHYNFVVVDEVEDYQLMALSFDNNDKPKFNDNVKYMSIDSDNFTIFYSCQCPYAINQVKELHEYNQSINFIEINTLEKAKNMPCIFNNWANFYQRKFISNTILSINSFDKIFNGR